MERVNNATWCCEQIEEKLKQWKAEVEKSRNTRHYEDETLESGRRMGMEEIISDIPAAENNAPDGEDFDDFMNF